MKKVMMKKVWIMQPLDDPESPSSKQYKGESKHKRYWGFDSLLGALACADGPLLCRIDLGGDMAMANGKWMATKMRLLDESDVSPELVKFVNWCRLLAWRLAENVDAEKKSSIKTAPSVGGLLQSMEECGRGKSRPMHDAWRASTIIEGIVRHKYGWASSFMTAVFRRKMERKLRSLVLPRFIA